MPAYRSKICCASAIDPIPKARKPSQPRTKLSPEEKLLASLEAEERKAKREAKKEWEASLNPWVVEPNYRFPVGTLVSWFLNDLTTPHTLLLP